jgi:catechol 2,3-dioxygenase-like lactoylglutathione lyase family enzyme
VSAVAPLVPELIVTDIARSRAFYEGVLGFSVMWERPEEGFVYLGREGAEIMLDLVSEKTAERGFLLGPLDYPCGRGVSFQIRASDVDALYSRAVAANGRITLAMEEKWYRAGVRELGNRQFIVADPDGYLLRFFQDLGERAIPA